MADTTAEPGGRPTRAERGGRQGRAERGGRQGRADPGGRQGRRPGNQDTRGAILAAAREAFAARGFAGASIRSIAAAAGVDAALVHHYFATKQQLFLATSEIPVPITDLVAGIVGPGLDGLGHRLLSTILGVWESEAQPALVAAFRTLIADPERMRGMREFLTLEVIGSMLKTLDVPRAEANRRAALVAAQVVGLVAARYLVEVPLVRDQSVEALVTAVGPVLQGYLEGRFERPEETVVAELSPTPPRFGDESVARWLSRVDDLERQMLPVSEALFAKADLQPGERVIDVGCGSGATTGQAHAAVAPDGRVVGIDVSPSMIEAAISRVGSEGIEWIVADAGGYPYEEGAFDAVISRFGVMFFDDTTAAFANLGRACRSGGRLTVVVWGSRESSPFFDVPIRTAAAALREAGAPVRLPPPGFGPFALGDLDALRSILTDSGWVDIAFDRDLRPLTLGGGGTLEETAQATLTLGPVQMLVAGQSDEAIAAVREALVAEFGRHWTDAGVALPGGFVVVTARRP